jgi:hypothetical protein
LCREVEFTAWAAIDPEKVVRMSPATPEYSPAEFFAKWENVRMAISRLAVLNPEIYLAALESEVGMVTSGNAESGGAQIAMGSATTATPSHHQLAQELPQWKAETNRLFYKGVELMKVGRQASRMRCVLDAFESQDWKSCIDNPLKDHVDPQALGDAVKGLNDKLAKPTAQNWSRSLTAVGHCANRCLAGLSKGNISRIACYWPRSA